VGHADRSNFLIAEAGGAAALTGLIFVAVSINLSKILEYPGVSTRAAEAILVLLGALLVSSIALVPSQSDRAMGFAIFAIGGAIWVTVTSTHIRFRFPRATTGCGGSSPGWLSPNWRYFPSASPEPG
jgi:hypothetical protein